MICKYFYFILFVFSTIICGQDQGKHSTYYYQRFSLFESFPNDSNEIIFLGNSITDGCEWSELFKDLRIKNRGISGDISEGILDRLDKVLEGKPDKIFLMIGINDLAFGVEFDTIIMNYKKIISSVFLKSPNTKLFIQSVLPVNPNFEKFKNHTNKTNEIIKLNTELVKLCEFNSLTYIDLYSHFVDEKNYLSTIYTNDGLHLLGPGYLLWKSLVEEYIYSY
ncbi:MAG: hypothetical protein JW866_10660 [Ignavibacteriales bacterium]|nr:hypothetical protein [Ignavibacteriales bacterium]